MFSEKEELEIRKRLSRIPDLGHREQGQRIELEKLFDEICGLDDGEARTEKQKLFQEKLLGLERYVTYLKGTSKI